MARCPPELLDDLASLFTEIRTWSGIVERSRGVFYLARAPFLHFHRQADGRRRADVKGPRGWQAFDLPRPLSAARQRAFLRELRRRHLTRQEGRLSTREGRRSDREHG